LVYPAEKRGLFALQLHGHLAAILNMGKHDNVGGGRGLKRTRLRPDSLITGKNTGKFAKICLKQAKTTPVSY
jgi:hypothetical protein